MRRLGLLIAVSMLLAACGESWAIDAIEAERATADIGPVPTPTSLAAPSTFAVPGYEPRFEPTACPMPVEGPIADRVECGVLVVPVDREEIDGKQARVAVAIVRSSAAEPASDPVLYLHGGPGGNALPDYDQWTFPRHQILDTRDLVLMDQRGSGYSQPSLNCTEFDDRFFSNERALEQCFDRIEDDGTDPSRFTTFDIALDVADLRIALGYDEWNLYGISYGTRVALEVMRSAPEGVRSVILDSPYPPKVESYSEQAPNGAAAIDAVLEACASEAACNKTFPALADRLDQVLDDLRNDPEVLEIEDWFSGEIGDVYLDDHIFANAIFATLYDTYALRDVPLAIHTAAEGDLGAAAEFLGIGQGFRKARARRLQVDEDDAIFTDEYLSLLDAEGAHWSPECAEEAAFSSERDARDAADLDQPIQRALAEDYSLVFAACDAWPVTQAPDGSQEPVLSDLATLVIVGEFDPITPPAWADQTVDDLTNATLVVVPAAGHGSTFERCPRQLMMDFLDNPARPLNAECLDDLGPDFNLD